MWYIFPQIQGLGSTETSKYYALKDLREAETFFAHELLGSRLMKITNQLLQLEESNANKIFGSPDDLKLRSCATLFACVSPEGSVFHRLLEKFYHGERDEKTLRLLGIEPEGR